MLFQSALLLAVVVCTAFAGPTPKLQERNAPCTQCVSSPNNCDITAPCSSFLNGADGQDRLYCGCRPGYKASNVADGDTNSQWRLNFVGHEHRVWVAPGVVCDQLCDNPFGTTPCFEVTSVDQCKP